MSLAKSQPCQLDSVQTPGECCIFAEHDDLGVIWIFCHLFTGLDKFYGFCSAPGGKGTGFSDEIETTRSSEENEKNEEW